MATESPLKMMKNAFYFTLKALSLSRYLNVCLDFLVMQKTDENEMKFAQLIQYDIRNIFLEKSYKKCGGKTIPRPFSKKSKLCIYLDQ